MLNTVKKPEDAKDANGPLPSQYKASLEAARNKRAATQRAEAAHQPAEADPTARSAEAAQLPFEADFIAQSMQSKVLAGHIEPTLPSTKVTKQTSRTFPHLMVLSNHSVTGDYHIQLSFKKPVVDKCDCIACKKGLFKPLIMPEATWLAANGLADGQRFARQPTCSGGAAERPDLLELAQSGRVGAKSVSAEDDYLAVPELLQRAESGYEAVRPVSRVPGLFPLSTDLTNEYLKQDDRRLPAQEEYLWMSCFGAHMAALFVALDELLPYVPSNNQDFTPYLARARNHPEAIDKAFRFRLAFLRRLNEIKRVHGDQGVLDVLRAQHFQPASEHLGSAIFGDLMRDYERRVFEATVASSAKATATSRVAAAAVDELGQRTLDLLSSSLRAQTLKSYAGRLAQFAEFCHDSENISPLEATTATVVRYVAWIGERGHIAAKSLQPYLSAINTFFELHNLVPIAKDSLHLTSARQSHLDYRALLASVVNFLFFARGLTGVSCRVQDVHVDTYNITLQIYREKGRAGRRGPDDLRVLLLPVSEHPRVARLLRYFIDNVQSVPLVTIGLATSNFWAVNVAEQSKPWTAATMSDWLSTAVNLVNAAPPAGTSWTSHSLRKGAASAANAIGAPLSHIRYQGGWATNSDVVLDYIDPNVLPSPGAWFFFGHIAPLRHFQVQQDSAAVAFPVPPS
eukprot:jgi/Tetstr1/455667/TSEL_042478.t1